MKRKAPRFPTSPPSDLLLSVEQEERRQISSALFNSTSEKLAALKIYLRAIERSWGPQTNDVKATMAVCFSVAQECEHELRKFSDLLYPRILDEFGLAAALRAHVKEPRRNKLQARLSFDRHLPKRRFPRLLEFTLFRFVQMALVILETDFGAALIRARLLTRQNDNQIALGITGDGRHFARSTRISSKTLAIRYRRELTAIGQQIKELGGKLNIRSSERRIVLTAVLPTTTDPIP
jgi:signal transduction histidine kinase